MRTESLINILQAIQGLQNWTTAELAKELGVSPRLIPMLYRGERGIGVEFLGAIGRRFPALEDQIWKALLEKGYNARREYALQTEARREEESCGT